MTTAHDRSRLMMQLGRTLRHQRQLRSLRQSDLATRVGVSQTAIARIERGDRATSLCMIERLFAALDLQLRFEPEPLDAHIDAALDRLAEQPREQRIDELRLADITDSLAGIPFAFDGPTAALLQGAPLPGEIIHIALPWSASDAFTAWLTRGYAQRWHEAWETYGFLALEPESPGAHRWQTMVGVLAARMVDELPDTLEVRHGAKVFRAVPLPDVEVADRATAELLQRHRTRLAAAVGESSR